MEISKQKLLYLLIFLYLSPLSAQINYYDYNQISYNSEVFIKAESDKYFLTQPKALKYIKGFFYLLDRNEPFIKKFDSNGVFINQFIRKGKGPGELLSPLDMEIIDNKYFLIYDISLNRFIQIDFNGNYITSMPVSGNIIKYRTTENGTIIYLTKKLNFNNNKGSSFTVHIKNKDTDREIFNIKIIDRIFLKKYKLFLIQPFSKKIFIEPLANNNFIVITSDYKLIYFDKSGKLLNDTSHSYISQKITNRDKENFFNSIGIVSPSGVIKKGLPSNLIDEIKFPKYKKAIENIFVDNSGNLLIKLFGMDKDAYNHFDIYNNEGVFIKNISILKGQMNYPNVIFNDKFYQLENDVNGLFLVKKYHLSKNSN